MKKWLDTYFGFSQREFNGLMTLVALIGLTMLLPYVYSLIKEEEPVTEAEQQAVLKLALLEQQKILLKGRDKLHFKHRDKRNTQLFMFDPNTNRQEDWEKLGLSVKQASAILNYTARGGRFNKVEDLKKMYTISEATYRRLVPYVKIAPINTAESQPKVYIKQQYESRVVVKIEINNADTTELDKIKGIGMTFANRIVKYRDRIGGFYKKEQLMEVFGLDSVKYNEIKDQILVDASRLKRINVNTARFEDFKNHPYIRYKQVNALIAYRKQHGNYGNIADLNKVAILDQETINRLAAYLEF
ncbi:ComEA family DNA-binding protein [Pedobacter nyackensis]|uniref:ComEA family DNA-binding protein n=1 Tax=Pedobacter nyackensis TaxID=475255 RepID=UPI00292EC7C6|nr:helix-hairpin-helix domain-containing protein [Pedobacter nyackensis]